MGAGTSTLVVLLAWAMPIAIAVIFMALAYRSPSEEELRQADDVFSD